MFCLLTYTLLHEQWAIFIIRKKTFSKKWNDATLKLTTIKKEDTTKLIKMKD